MYDKQQLIYADLLKEVDEATAALDPAADIATGDVFYKGNIAQWQALRQQPAAAPGHASD
ncbi:MAG: SusD/RagB family nutrient-binding outer membrane lipoprotein [Hymenobacter sp.]